MKYQCTTVILQEGKWYVARAVELGVVSQGKTIESAKKNLQEAVALYLGDSPRSKKFFSKSSPLIMTLEVEYA